MNSLLGHLIATFRAPGRRSLVWAILALGALGAIGPAAPAAPAAHAAPGAHPGMGAAQRTLQLADLIHAQAPNISIRAITTAIDAYLHFKAKHLTDKPLVTIVDYSLSSAKRRLAVADVQTGKVLYYTYVAHGKGSGGTYAKRFSNTPGSDASSLGVYLTGRTYYGEHGYSLRLHGLNPQFNGAAYRRDIVMHSAWYVSRKFAQEHGRMGRSWGCFALSRRVESDIVRLIRDGTVLVGYYPDPQWFASFPYLHRTA